MLFILYRTKDFSDHDWTEELGDDCKNALAFIDDHQNNYLRLKYLTPPVQYDKPPEELQDIPNLTQIPAGTPTGVYFLCQGKKIVYVGQSNSPSARISQHQKDKIFDLAYMIPTDQPLALEDYYINKFKPIYNKTIKKEYYGNT